MKKEKKVEKKHMEYGQEAEIVVIEKTLDFYFIFVFNVCVMFMQTKKVI